MSTLHLEKLSALVGPANCFSDATDTDRFATDYRGIFRGQALAVVRPANTTEVSQVMAYCYANNIPVVPQGGNTSLLGGAVPDASGTAIILNLSRLNHVRSIDAVNDAMTVEAGVTLKQARDQAEQVERLFPLQIGSEGSCQIGGNLSTNAGGTSVVRYGNMRDLVLGVEVVLPNGDVWDGLRALRKDNTGYDFKHLFIGGEGTLGIVTAVVLKLFPKPHSVTTGFLGFKSPAQALAFFTQLRERVGQDVVAFELISQAALDLVLEHLSGTRPPLSVKCPWYVLVELASSRSLEEMENDFYDLMQSGLEDGSIQDAAVAKAEAHAIEFWRIREEISDAQTRAGGSVRCDISVPLSKIPSFIEEASARVRQIAPDTRMVIYGHVGDGNVHFNPLRPATESASDFLGRVGSTISSAVDALAMEMQGSISAEHGVGLAKRDELLHVKSKIELEMAWKVKQAFDPKNLLNPGKFLPHPSLIKDLKS